MNRKKLKTMDKQMILETVCREMNVAPESIMSKCRKSQLVRTRQICMYFASEYFLGCQREIGAFYGGRDHATVVFARRAVKNDYETNKIFRHKIEHIKSILYEKESDNQLQELIGEDSNYDYQYIL